jgi:hypothetical protein
VQASPRPKKVPDFDGETRHYLDRPEVNTESFPRRVL